MARIKIAHIITHLELGGAQKTTLLFLRHLDKEKYEPHLITSPGGLLQEEAQSLPDTRVYSVPSLAKKVSPLKDIASFFKISKYLKKENICLVHTHSSKAGIIGRWAARFAGVPYIFHTVHGWPFYIETNIFVKFVYMVLEKITSRITTKMVVVSDADLKAGLKWVNRNKAKYVKISYGIESRRFFKNSQPERHKDIHLLESLGIREDACVVSFISCLKPQKAPLDFVNIAKRVLEKGANVEFLSVGDGVLGPAMKTLSSQLGLSRNIRFLGWQKDIPGLLSITDILLLTSRWEGLPVVFLEAMASGVPVVATDVGGAHEVIKDGLNGFLKRKGACRELADSILFLANNIDKRKTFSSSAKESFRQEFDISHMTEQLQNLYEQNTLIEEGG